MLSVYCYQLGTANKNVKIYLNFYLLKCHVIFYKKLCYRKRTARRFMSVKILSTVETSCITNPQQIAVMELEGYS